MSGTKRVLITFIIASLICAVFALTAHFGLLSVIESKFYKPMVFRQLEERNDLLSETVGKYIDTQDALFTLFAANPEIRVITQKEQDELIIKSRANLASDLLTETPGLEGLRVIGENGKTIYYSTFPQDFAVRKEDEPAAYRNYPKNDIPFESIAAAEEDKSRILNDSENNRLVFSYPFYDNEMTFIGTIAFYVDAPSMLRYFIPTDRLSAKSGIYLWSTPKDDVHGFVFSVPEGLETICKNAAVSSWISSQKLFSFDDMGKSSERENYILVSGENTNGYVSTVFKEEILHMPQHIRNIIVLATISLIFFISFICCIARNAAEKHAENSARLKKDEKLAEEAASEVNIRIDESDKDEPLLEKLDDVFETLAAQSVPVDKAGKKLEEKEDEENSFVYDEGVAENLFIEESENSEEENPETEGLFEEIYEEEIKNENQASQNQLEIAGQIESESNEKVALNDDSNTSVIEDEMPENPWTSEIIDDAETSSEKEASHAATAAFLDAIDERMHQRKEIIEEYTHPVLKADEEAEFEFPAFDEMDDIPVKDEIGITVSENKSERLSLMEDKDTGTAAGKSGQAPEALTKESEKETHIKHGLLSAGNAYLAEEEKKERAGDTEIKSAPLRKSSLSTIFKEKINNSSAVNYKEPHSYIQQSAPSKTLSDISEHGLLSRGDTYRSNLPQKPALYTLELKKNIKASSQNTDKQNTQSAVAKQQKENKMNPSFYDESLEELEPAVETETVTSIFSLQSAPQLFAAFSNKEADQRASFERKGIADRIVESTNAKMVPVFTETEHKIDNIHIENGVYRIHEENNSPSDVKINYDFKRLVDSVLNG